MFRSATFKLTLWYICLVMAISVLFSVILYQVAGNQLSSDLMHQSARIYNQFPVFQGDPILRPRADITSGDHRILARLILFNALVVIAAGFGSYALARRTLAPIEEAHEQQKRFTADVSHELRTPLTALRMESEVTLMNPEADTKELRDTLTSNLEEVTKVESLINNLFRLTRLEADELREQFIPLSAVTLLELALENVGKPAEQRAITLMSKAPKEDFMVLGDQTSVVQLLVTLLDNAIKYSAPNKTVTLSAEKQDRHAIFTVVDHGIGIEPAALEHVFDRFYRADSSRNKTSVSGFGLGLSIAKMIADVHNSTIIITSNQGHGTTVTVTLPLAPATNS
jgi:two-component system sensor histidine kinase CiaH